APLSDFLFDHLRRESDPASEEGRARLVELGRPLVSKLPSGAFRELIVQRLAREARMDEAALRELLGERPRKTAAPQPRRRAGTERVRNAPSPVRHAITLLLQYPALATEAGDPEQLDELQMPGAALLAEMVSLLREHPHLNTAALLEHWRDTDAGRHLGRLAVRELGLADEEQVKAEFRDTLALLRRKERARRRRERLEALQARPFRELSEEERNELKRLLDESADRDFT
ncbi:MAG TPA: DNA primase, partial [Gammaproteobacteria bacterium]|nr:DNA primase [Gammaproteobacteria bacterium]